MINQRDGNTHQILFKLVDGCKFFNVSGYEPEISFYDEDTKTVVITSAVTVLNDYRGYLSYTIGNSLLRKNGRYTVTLKLKGKGDGCDCGCGHHGNLTFKFILNVVKSQDSGDSQCPCHNYEVPLTKEFYDKLCAHLNNRLIHLSESDRIVLNSLSDMLNYIVTSGGGFTHSDIVHVLAPREDFAELVQQIVGVTPEEVLEINERLNQHDTQIHTLEVTLNETVQLVESLRTLVQVDKVSIERDKDSVMRIHDFGKYYWDYDKFNDRWVQKLWDDTVDFDLQLVSRKIVVRGQEVLVALWIKPIVSQDQIYNLFNTVNELTEQVTQITNNLSELTTTVEEIDGRVYNIESKIDSYDTKIENLTEQVTNLGDTVNEMQEDITNIYQMI